MKTEEFIKIFRENKNLEKSQPMAQYMRNQFSFLGLQASERRKLARAFLTEKRAEAKNKSMVSDSRTSVIDWNLLFHLWELPEREFQLTGLDYLKRVENYFVLDDFSYLRQLVLTKSWWDTVDFLAKNIGSLVLKEPALMEEMRNWSVEENIWIRRVAILHQLAFKEETNKELLEDVIVNNLSEDEFFIQKAMGWALREYAKTDERWVLKFVEKYRDELSPLSYREATKNIK